MNHNIMKKNGMYVSCKQVTSGEAKFQRLASKFSQTNHLKSSSSSTMPLGPQMCINSVCTSQSILFLPPHPSFATVPASHQLRKERIITMSPQIIPHKINQNKQQGEIDKEIFLFRRHFLFSQHLKNRDVSILFMQKRRNI